MNLKDFVDAGVGVIMLAALIGGYRRYWVYYWVFAQMVEERDFWRKMALASTGLAEKASRLQRAPRVPPARRRGDG